MDTCIPGKVPLQDCAGCRFDRHCLLQRQAKFPYMDVLAGAPAWWWAGYISAGEAQTTGWQAEADKPEYQRQPPQIQNRPTHLKVSTRQRASPSAGIRPPRMTRPAP